MATGTVAPGHSGSQAQPDTFAPIAVVTVAVAGTGASTRSTAPPAPRRYLGGIEASGGLMSRGQTRPCGQGVSSGSLQSSMALPTHVDVQPGDVPAPQHSGLFLQTFVVQGLQSQGSGAFLGPVSRSPCVQAVGEKICRLCSLFRTPAHRPSSMSSRSRRPMLPKSAHSPLGDSSRYRVLCNAESRFSVLLVMGRFGSQGMSEMKYSCAIIQRELGSSLLNGLSNALGQMTWRVSKRSTSVPFFV